MALAGILCGGPAATAAEAAGAKLYGRYKVVRTAYSAQSTKPVASSKRETWQVEKGCEPGRICVGRIFKQKSNSVFAPYIKVLKRRKNSHGSYFNTRWYQNFQGECQPDSADTANMQVKLKIYRLKSKGGQMRRFSAILSFKWPAQEFDSISQKYLTPAGQATARYVGKYTGPSTEGYPNARPFGGEAESLWFDNYCSSV